MLVVNLYGAPCAGKSTAAAYVFAQLKMAGVSCELVTEFAKDMVYDDNKAAFRNQAFIFGNQYQRLLRLEGKGIDVAVTDSPLLLGIYYNENPWLGDEFESMVAKVAKQAYPTLNYFLENKWDFSQVGRREFEKSSKEIAEEIKELLWRYDVEYRVIDDLDEIVYEIIDGGVKNV